MINISCQMCDLISRINVNEQKYFITELETGYVFLNNRLQYFRGYTIFVSKICINEIHLLPPDFRKTFLYEMTIVSEAVRNAFNASKINCESLGNSCSHVHWHIIPRYGTDPCRDKAIWNIDRSIIDSVVMEDDELMEMQHILIDEMKRLAMKYGIISS
jgi:diadenosine tetraphosphate (Ap4A) HIT family hydrolase